MRFHRTRISGALAAALGLSVVPYCAAQVVRDGTIGPAAAPVLPAANEYRILQSHGQTVGGNLFHSFSQFDIAQGLRATFAGPAEITNIISRVTGATRSTIDGALRSEIAGANLFLINPRGITFGSTASIDVSGSFHASTAHYLALGPSDRFDTLNATPPVLSSAAPSAFGFVAQPVADIVVSGSSLIGARGAALTLTGGTIQVSGSALLAAPSGFLGIASVAGPGEIALFATDLLPQAGMARGAITVTSSAVGASSGGGLPAGKVVIRGGVLTLQTGAVGLENEGPTVAAGVVVDASESLSMTSSSRIGTSAKSAGGSGSVSVTSPTIVLDNSSRITTFSESSGAAGSVDVSASQLSLAAGSLIQSRTIAGGDAGSVTVSASQSLNMTGGITAINSVSSGDGRGGDILITTPSLAANGSLVSTEVSGGGAGGSISIQANQVSLSNGAQFLATSTSPAPAGNLTVDATTSVELAGRGNGRASGFSTSGTGSGASGNIVVRTPELNVDNAVIGADASGTGAPGGITLSGQRIAITGGGSVSSSSRAPGAGSTLTVTASESLTVAGQDAGGNRSVIAGATGGEGSGTQIVINAPVVTLDSGAITTAASAGGPGGSISIDATQVALVNGGLITSNSSGAGRSGDVSITASESISMSGTFAGDAAGVVARALSTGDGGTVSLTAPTITLDGARVNVSTGDDGTAGNIAVNAARVSLVNGGFLDSSTTSRAPAGRIDVNASESLTLSGASATQASAITSTASVAGAAGEIHIASPRITVDGGLISGATSGAGAGGSIDITTTVLELLNKGQVASNTSGPGPGGRININAVESVSVTSRSAGPLQAGIFAGSSGRGRGGDIEVTAAHVNVAGGSITASALGAGPAGSIAVRGLQIAVSGGGVVDSSAAVSASAGRILIDATESIEVSGTDPGRTPSRVSTLAAGTAAGGEVILRAPLITIDQGTVRADASDNGLAGQITVEAGRLTLKNRGRISSSTINDATGGKVSVTATEAVTIEDSSANLLGSGLFAATAGRGRGGEIEVRTPLLRVTGGAISTTTLAAGDAGRIFVAGQDVFLRAGGFIDSSSLGGSGAGGVVNVAASRALTIAGTDASGTKSTISSATTGPGRGGDVLLGAPTLTVDNGAVSVSAGARGSAGRIAIGAERVMIVAGGELVSGTSGAGDGGTLNVTATESIVVSGGNGENRSRISNSSSGGGNAGEIALNAPSIRIEDRGFVRGTASAGGSAGNINIRGSALTLASGGEISTSASASGRGGAIDARLTESVSMTDSAIRATSGGSGDAGSIFVDAGRSLTMVRSAITTEATRADGGNIELNAIDLLRLIDSRITTSVGNGFGNGGNIIIDPTFVILDSGRIIANAFGGNGGNINITTDALLKSGDSVIEASSQLGISGTITISSPDADLAGGLTPLTGGLFDPSLLLRESCSARAGRAGNSFVGVGHGGLPPQPGSLAFSSYSEADVSSAAGRAPVFALAEAFANACAR